MTDKEIRKVIHKKYNDYRQYAVIDEVCVTTGFYNHSTPRRIDMIVINCFECNGFSIEGIEIKISKSDLKRELNNPQKHEVFFNNIDYYTIAAPVELINETRDIMPEKWGLLGISENGQARYIRKPKLISKGSGYFEKTINRGFFASVVRGILRTQGGNT